MTSKSIDSIEFDPNGWNTTEATAKRLKVSPSYLNKARLTGDGPEFAKFGRSVRYFGPKVLVYEASRARCSTSDQGGGKAA